MPGALSPIAGFPQHNRKWCWPFDSPEGAGNGPGFPLFSRAAITDSVNPFPGGSFPTDDLHGARVPASRVQRATPSGRALGARRRTRRTKRKVPRGPGRWRARSNRKRKAKDARRGLVISDLHPVVVHVPPVECYPLLQARAGRVILLSSGFPKRPTLVSLCGRGRLESDRRSRSTEERERERGREREAGGGGGGGGRGREGKKKKRWIWGGRGGQEEEGKAGSAIETGWKKLAASVYLRPYFRPSFTRQWFQPRTDKNYSNDSSRCKFHPGIPSPPSCPRLSPPLAFALVFRRRPNIHEISGVIQRISIPSLGY